MKRNRWFRGGGVVSLAAALACGAHNRSEQKLATIDDSSLTRLSEKQMEPVDDARVEEGRARDALARAKANENEARTRVSVARAERDVAVAQQNRAKAEHELLVQQKAPPADQARAAEAEKQAQERLRATDLKIDYLNKMVVVAEKDRELAEAHLRTATAQVEQTKYQTLAASDPNQLQGVDGPRINAQLANLQAQESAARRQAADRRVEAVDAYNRWQELDARVRATAAVQPQETPAPTTQPMPQTRQRQPALPPSMAPAAPTAAQPTPNPP